MREILERHAQHLTSDERRVIWERVSSQRTVVRQAPSRWLFASAATAAAIAVALVMLRTPHAPVAPPPTHAPNAERVAPLAPSVKPAAPVLAHDARPLPEGRSTRHGGGAPRSTQAVAPTPEQIANRALATAGPERLAPKPAAAPLLAATGGPGVLTGRVVDRNNQPVAYANVTLPHTNRGTLTDANGTFKLKGLPAGTYDVRANMFGYRPETRSVRVEGDQPVAVDLHMADQVVQTVEEISVSAERRLVETKQSATLQSITPEKLREIPVDNLSQSIATRGGVVAQGGELHFRGGRGGDVKFQFNGLEASGGKPAQPPVVPTTGGTALPNDEAFDSMFFKNYGVNPFIPTDEDALSTFAVDVDAASYTIMRRYIGLGHLPPADAVRVEEFVNFFAQGYPRFTNDDFRIVVDGAPSPFGAGYQLLRIGIKGREIAEQSRKPAQLTFAIDVSGSMAREDRLGLVKQALRLLVDRLRADDRVGIVIYGTNGRVLLEPIAMGSDPAPAAGARDDDWTSERVRSRGGNRQRILDAIDQLQSEGSTNAEEGLRLAYDMARQAYRAGAINRIVLCSDGVANVGRTGPESILTQVRSEADRGIHLTTIGFGMGNYNDVLMEQLADKGDGNHYYVDDIGEARRVFVEHLTGTLQTIAKDAKVQVEFDSTRVLRYRLVGFENRDVADRDFRNDKVDAGEIGAGHEVTALYEVKLAPHAAPGTLATVRFRWARPESEGAGAPRVREIEQRFATTSLARRFEDASPRFRLDAAAAEFAELLRGSYWARDGRMADVLPVAREAARDLRDEPSAEFVRLLVKAAVIGGLPKPGGDGPGH